jgi:hypothetical protein
MERYGTLEGGREGEREAGRIVGAVGSGWWTKYEEGSWKNTLSPVEK